MKDPAPDSLCHTCTHGMIVRGDGIQEIKICKALDTDRVIRMRVTKCTTYRNKNDMTLHDMEQIGWLIEVRKNTIGFHKPKSEKHEEFRTQWTKRGYVDPIADD